MRFTALFSAVAIVTALAATSASAAHLDNPNRLANAGFEDPVVDTADTFYGRWQPFSLDGDAVMGGDTAQSGMSMPRTGASALELVIDNTANSFAGAFQDVRVSPLSAGNQWWYSGWAKSTGIDDGASEIRIEWRDSVSNTEITRTPNSTPVLTADYTEFILSDTIPAGADTARVVYAIQSFGGGPNQAVLVDDVNFNLVPEPTSVTLALLAGLSLVGLRRRS